MSLLGRKISAGFRRIGIPLMQTPDWKLLYKLRKHLSRIPRYERGNIDVEGWNIEYVDAASFVSAVENVVFKRYNDFVPKSKSPVILDCGANIGVSVIHYKRLFPEAKITAFEPDAELCKVLRRNLLNNGISDVEIVEAAIWKENGELEFFSEGADAGRLDNNQNDINSLLDKSPKGKISRVRSVRLMDYLADKKIDFIKLDIEGAESSVLADCAGELKNVDSMVVEFHLTNARPDELAAVMNALHIAKFSVSVNSYGEWIKLTNKDTVRRNPVEYDQYLLLDAWRA